MVIDGITKASFDELVEIETADGERRLGKVLEVGFGKAIVQVFEGTTGLSITGTKAKFLGKTMEMPVSQELLGRVFDGLGRPNDSLPDPIADKFLDVNGEPMNPERREYPTSFIRAFPDRKSTRLNSSHEWISYAVFCLKKKSKK